MVNMSGSCRVVAVAMLLILLFLPLNIEASNIQIEESNGWRIINTTDLTVMFTSNGSRPMFVWWRSDINNTRYLVDFVGLWEYFTAEPIPSPFKRANIANTINANITLINPVIDELRGLSICIGNAIKIINQYEEVRVNIEDFKNQIVAVILNIDNVTQNVELYNKSITTLRDSIRSLKIKYRSFDPYIYVKKQTINEMHLNLDEILLILSDMTSLNVTAILLYIRIVDEKISRLNDLISDLNSQFKDLSIYIDNLIANEYCSSCRNVMNSTRNDCLTQLNSLVSRFNELNVAIKNFNTYVKTFIDMGGLELVNREILLLNNLLVIISPTMDSLDSTCKSIIGRVRGYLEGSVESYLKYRASIINNLTELKSRLIVLEENVNNTVDKIIENMRQIMGFIHPPFLSFQECEWSLTDLKYISLEGYGVIGVAFTYILKSAPPRFKFAEGNIMIRCRLYMFPVVEEIGGLKYSVSNAELKIDFIVQNWIWTTSIIKDMITRTVNLRINTSRSLFNALALQVNLASINMTHVKNVWCGQYGGNLSASNTILLKDLNLNIDIDVETWNEVEIKMEKLPLKFNFMSEGKMLTGFFKFTSEAVVHSPNSTYSIISIYVSYLKALGFLKLYICYPYFDNGMLEHDPSLGIEVEEKQPVAKVNVSIASGLNPYIASIEVKPLAQSISPTTSKPPVTLPITVFPTLEVMAAIAALIIIIVILLLFSRRLGST